MIDLTQYEFSPVEQNFADLMLRLAPEGGDPLRLAAAAAMHAVSRNQICCDLAQFGTPQDFPENWISMLYAANAVISRDGSTPLVLENTRIYLQKMYRKEVKLAEDLNHFARKRADFDPVRTGKLLRKLFPEAPASDRQMLAALAAARGHLTVLSGGPGTGKTYTAGKILQLLRGLYGEDLRIFGAAPTGKAAGRLAESLGIQTATIHRLLGISSHFALPRYRRTMPLPCDVVILDEVSMVSLSLLSDFFAAMPPDATVILLGDQDQLSSVEPGAVFGDLCAVFGGGEMAEDFRQDCLLTLGEIPEDLPGGTGFFMILTQSHRFPPAGAVAQLSRAIHVAKNRDDAAKAQQMFHHFPEEIHCFALPEDWQKPNPLWAKIREGYAPLCEAKTPAEALEAMDRFRILTAVHHGTHGREKLNQITPKILKMPRTPGQSFYNGHPILIQKNAPQLQLFNGDTGVLWQIPGTENFAAHFRTPENTLRAIPVELLPAYDSAYAITVHRAQGSEFERLLLILPPSDFYSRELIYTGLTRTCSTVVVAGGAGSIEDAILRRAERTSGLRDRLQQST